MVGEDPTTYVILALRAVNGLSLSAVYLMQCTMVLQPMVA